MTSFTKSKGVGGKDRRKEIKRKEPSPLVVANA
jgi:hypothetical protein